MSQCSKINENILDLEIHLLRGMNFHYSKLEEAFNKKYPVKFYTNNSFQNGNFKDLKTFTVKFGSKPHNSIILYFSRYSELKKTYHIDCFCGGRHIQSFETGDSINLIVNYIRNFLLEFSLNEMQMFSEVYLSESEEPEKSLDSIVKFLKKSHRHLIVREDKMLPSIVINSIKLGSLDGWECKLSNLSVSKNIEISYYFDSKFRIFLGSAYSIGNAVKNSFSSLVKNEIIDVSKLSLKNYLLATVTDEKLHTCINLLNEQIKRESSQIINSACDMNPLT